MSDDNMPTGSLDEQGANMVPEQTTAPPLTDAPPPTNELLDLRLQVHGVHKFQMGLTAFLAIVAVFAAIVISFLGWLGISGTIDRNVEERVQQSVDQSIAQVVSNFDNILVQAGNAAATSESASIRAEAQSSSSASSAETAQAALSASFILSTQAAVAAGSGEWIVAIASLEQIEDALEVVDKAVKVGYQPVVYYFDGLFVPAIGIFQSKEEADITRLAVASTLRVDPALFDLKIACPFRSYDQRGFFKCYLNPTPVPTP